MNVTEEVVRSNAAVAEMFGVDAAEAARGLPVSSYMVPVHPDDAARVVERLEHAVRTLGTYSEFYQIQDAKGQYKLVFEQGAAYRAGDGTIMFPGTVIAVDLQQIAAIRRDERNLDAIAAHCLAARDLANRGDLKVVKHLLDMTLEEVGFKLAAALKKRLADW